MVVPRTTTCGARVVAADGAGAGASGAEWMATSTSMIRRNDPRNAPQTTTIRLVRVDGVHAAMAIGTATITAGAAVIAIKKPDGTATTIRDRVGVAAAT